MKLLTKWQVWVTIIIVLTLATVAWFLWVNSQNDTEEIEEPVTPKNPPPPPLDNTPTNPSTAGQAGQQEEKPTNTDLAWINGETIQATHKAYEATGGWGVPYSPNFKFSEFFTRDAQYNRYAPPREYWASVQELMDNLEVLRAYLGNKPINITSSCRCKYHNKDAGGVWNSRHRTCQAADIQVSGVPAYKVQQAIKELKAQGKMTAKGLGLYNTFTHIDLGPDRVFDKRT